MAGQLTIDTLKASTGVLATQNGMTGIAKAWASVNYTSGSPVINGSFNVSSFTTVGAGVYTVNFTTAMVDTGYALAGTCAWTAAVQRCGMIGQDNTRTKTTSACPIVAQQPSTYNLYYPTELTVVFCGN